MSERQRPLCRRLLLTQSYQPPQRPQAVGRRAKYGRDEKRFEKSQPDDRRHEVDSVFQLKAGEAWITDRLAFVHGDAVVRFVNSEVQEQRSNGRSCADESERAGPSPKKPVAEAESDARKQRGIANSPAA